MHDRKCLTQEAKQLLTGFLMAVIFTVNGCSQHLPTQTAGKSAPPTDPSTPAKRSVTAGANTANDPGLRVVISPGEQAWTIQTTAANDSTYSIHVADSDGKKVQVMEDIAARPPLTAKELLQIRDYNADGYADIRASTLPVGGSAITGAMLYIFDPTSRKFIESEGVEQEGEIAIEPNGCISVQYRSDTMQYTKDHYCWKENRWELLRTTSD